MILQQHPALYVGPSAQRGRGVFTTEKLEADWIVIEAPVVVMSAKEKELLNQTALYYYIFDWEGEQCCMALGLIPILNHQVPSNCEYFQDYEQGMMYVKTVRPIEAGEELFINYNGDFDNNQPLWFDAI
ncbi:MAG: SET domain-containing protein [Chitinophagaceae bacterium]|nr:SET domain-containing protein [Chitinophagaceae bacterium]